MKFKVRKSIDEDNKVLLHENNYIPGTWIDDTYIPDMTVDGIIILPKNVWGEWD